MKKFVFNILIFILFTNLSSAWGLSPTHRDTKRIREELIVVKLRSKNWPEAEAAAKQIAQKRITFAEKELISLLKTKTHISLLERVVEALASIQSKNAVNHLIALFKEIESEIRYKFVLIKILDALGQSGSEEAMHFLGNVLSNPDSQFYFKEHAAKNLSFFSDPRAVEFLIDALQPEISGISKQILVSLRYNAEFTDIAKIEAIIDKISTSMSRNKTAYDKAVELEVGDFSKTQNAIFLYAFLKGSIDLIKNRLAEKLFVLGDIPIKIAPQRYEKNFIEFKKSKKLEQVIGRNSNLSIFMPVSEEVDSELLEKSCTALPQGEENPDVQIIIDTLRLHNIPFARSQDGLLMQQVDTRLGRWSKDGSVLIPTHESYIPMSFNFKEFPVRGETAIISGKDPLLIISDNSFSSITAFRSMKEKFPDIDVEVIPTGYLTIKLSNGETVGISTSHIDCVFDVIPQQLTKDGHPVVLVDPHYHQELISRKNTRDLLTKLQEKYEAKIVVIPEEETYLNPANFILLPDHQMVINKAPKTYEKLIQAGVKPESLIMTIKEIYSIAPLKGMIGCLGGIYTSDRVVSKPNTNLLEAVTLIRQAS
ncbi:HEAT repeat domain-containing protein [Candidatus Auribacterota bacterium]